MANTINRISGNGDRSEVEGIPTTEAQRRESREALVARRGRSAGGATRGDRETSSVGASRTGQQPKRDAALTSGNPQSEGGGEVQITNTAARLATVGQGLSASSPIDEARVARISQALADGSYRISAQQIASGLMQSDHALGQIGL